MPRTVQSYVVCVNNEGYETLLERRKIYFVLKDEAAVKHGLLRVVDESGDEYLYPREYFAAIDLSPIVRRALLIRSKHQNRRQLRSLLLDGAASPPGVAADDVYFDTLRDRVRSRTWG